MLRNNLKIYGIYLTFGLFIFIVSSCDQGIISGEKKSLQDNFHNGTSLNTNKQALKKEVPKWKKQLSKMLTKGNKRLHSTPLIGYKLVGKIKTVNEKQNLMKKLLSDNKYLPKYPSDSLRYYTPNNLNHLSLVKINRVKSLGILELQQKSRQWIKVDQAATGCCVK